MISRRGTPAFVVFASLLACLFLKPKLTAPWIPMAVAAACVCAAVAFIAHGRPAVKRVGLFAGAAALGFLLGSILLAGMARRAGSTALAVEAADVSSFTGTLVSDSVLTRESRTALHVSLSLVESERIGVRGQARADALVIIAGDYRFSQGERVSFQTGLEPFTGSGPEVFIAFADGSSVRSMGFSAPLWAIRARLRDGAHRSLERAGYPASALLEALLIGSREDIPAELSEGFERTGSQHILALSGLHAAVLYAVAAAFLGFFRNRRVTYVVATVALVFYQFIAGPIPSLLRATLMLAVGGAAALMDRDREPLNLLCLSGILILASDPYQAWSLSFQLSFLAILGILAAAPWIARLLEGRVPPLLLAPLALSAAAQIATFPVVTSAFGVYYPSGLIAGMILVPMTTGFLWMGLAWLLVSPILGGMLHHASAVLFDGVYRAILGSAATLARLPGVEFPPRAAPFVALLSAAVLLSFCLLPRRVDS